MGRFVHILVLLLVIANCGIMAQETSQPDPDTTNLINFTIFPKVDPFETDEIIRIKLAFDMKSFIRKKHKAEYQDAMLSVQSQGINIVENEIRIRARGEFRRSHCYMPPIKLNFKKTAFENEYLNDITTLKLVTHCKNSALYEEYLLKEFLVYRMFNILTDSSYRVRLVQMDYIDSEEKMKSLTKYGFIIESNDRLAERLNGVRIDREGIPTWATDPYLTNLMTIFQFMIGNTDWAIPPLHNMRLIKPSFVNSGILAIPYDFDYSGMVNTDYAIPDENLGTKSVRTRVYRGFCLPSSENYQQLFDVFLEKKQALFSLVENFENLDKEHKKEMLQYLEEFYHIIEHPYLANSEIISVCREIPKK